MVDFIDLATIALGLVVVVLAWLYFLERPESDEPAQPVKRQVPKQPVNVKRPSEDELASQNARRTSVRERCLPAGKVLAARASGDADNDTVREALLVLNMCVVENEKDGPLGVIASTELCNSLLEADCLKPLESMSNDPDPEISQRANAVFQHVIPRIWSF